MVDSRHRDRAWGSGECRRRSVWQTEVDHKEPRRALGVLRRIAKFAPHARRGSAAVPEPYRVDRDRDGRA